MILVIGVIIWSANFADSGIFSQVTFLEKKLIELIEFYRTYPTYKNLIHILMQNVVTISQFTRSE